MISYIKQSDMLKCPFYIIWPAHYRKDGTCKCSNKDERRMMIKEWGYKQHQFKNIPIID